MAQILSRGSEWEKLLMHDDVEVGEAIGSGTFGSVHRGRVGRENVAIKFLEGVEAEFIVALTLSLSPMVLAPCAPLCKGPLVP